MSRPARFAHAHLAAIGWASMMVVGIAYGAWKTRGFRGNLIDFELPPEES